MSVITNTNFNSDLIPGLVKKWFDASMKVYDPIVGEYGETVGPKKEGMLDQFTSLAWKFYGAYARPIENRILRAEVALARDA